MGIVNKGIAPLLVLDEARRKRWDLLTEPARLKSDMGKTTLIDESRFEQKRIILEALLDGQMRVQDHGTGTPEVLAESMIEPRFKGLMQTLDEADVTNQMGWTGGATNPDTAKIFTTLSLGIIRRVYPKLAILDLVSVQPMSQPTGKAFFLNYQYAHASGTIGVGEDLAGYTDNGTSLSEGLWTIDDMRAYADTLQGGASASEEGGGSAADVPREIKLDMSSVDLTVKAKKLAANYSVEIEQDLRAYHGVSADEGLMEATASEIARETDRDVITDMYSTINAIPGSVVVWAQNGGYSGSVPSEQKAAAETLFDAIEDASAVIERRRYVRPSWILTNVAGASRLRKLNAFQTLTPTSTSELGIGTGGRRIYGSIEKTIAVYIDPWFRKDDTYPSYLLGYKGSGIFEAGYVYAPYVSLYRTPLFTDPQTFANTRGMMSRYAKRMLVAGMYSILKVTAT